MSIPIPLNPLGKSGGSPYFEMTVRTSAANEVFPLYFKLDTRYSSQHLDVDWGDGGSNHYDYSTAGNPFNHTYAAAGTYVIKLKGEIAEFHVGKLSQTGTENSNVYACNCNFNALTFYGGGGSLKNAFLGCSNFTTLDLGTIPDRYTNLNQMARYDNPAKVTLKKLPASLVNFAYALYYNPNAEIDLNALAAKAPAAGFPACTNVAGAFYACRKATGSVAAFLHKFPAVTNVTNAFEYTLCTPFGAADCFEITVTTTSASQAWGFTPTSTTGRWYVFDWGDGTAVTANKNLALFTSGTKVEHTFSTAGTYAVKLAMNASDVQFDPYDGTNEKWELLGNPTHN